MKSWMSQVLIILITNPLKIGESIWMLFVLVGCFSKFLNITIVDEHFHS